MAAAHANPSFSAPNCVGAGEPGCSGGSANMQGPGYSGSFSRSTGNVPALAPHFDRRWFSRAAVMESGVQVPNRANAGQISILREPEIALHYSGIQNRA